MHPALFSLQKRVTQIFLFTSPLAFLLLVSTNFPTIEQLPYFTTIANLGGVILAVWFLSLIVVSALTFLSPPYRNQILSGAILGSENDERESYISSATAKKALLISLVTSFLLLLATTSRVTISKKLDGDIVNEKSYFTIGHIRWIDSSIHTEQSVDNKNDHHTQIFELPMSKTSLMLIVLLIQVFSFHFINFLSLRRVN